MNVDLTKFEIIELPKDFKEPQEETLSDGSTVKLRLLRVEDELKAVEFEKMGKNAHLYRYALSIVDESKNVFEKMEMLENLSAADLAYKIRAFHEKNFHGPKMEQSLECPRCGALEVVACPFRIDMVFPYGEKLREHTRA